MQQSLRIIGGNYRGKKITFLDSEGLRPTPNRVRETLFNWLMQSVRGAECLDAFSGSGALGFEALSRGASTVTLLEKSVPVYHHLTKQAASFKSTGLKLMQTDAYPYFTETKARFDILFFDPPFTHFAKMTPEIWQSIHRIMNTEGLLYIESPTPMTLSAEQWTCLKSKRAGAVYYSLHQKYSQ